MSNSDNKNESSAQELKDRTNNFTNTINNSFRPANINVNNIPNKTQNVQPKPNYPFPYVINPLVFNNPNFKQIYPQMIPNSNNINDGNDSDNKNINNTNGNGMKMPVMGIPVIFPTFMFGNQDQTPLLERCKIWIGKIPEGISETFMKKLLNCCGQVTSWRRETNTSGKLNSFGFCEYSTVESILKCLRLLNGYPLLGSELQVKIGSDTEEFLKKWRERKKIEWINSLAIQGIPVNIEEIKKKEENGEPLEWELRLVSNDQEVLKTINEVVSQRQQIDTKSKQYENDAFFKDLNDLANSNILENQREKDRKKKKMEKAKKFEKLFYDFEKNWLKHESNREKEKLKLKKEKENWIKKREKLIEKDLEYDSDKEKKYNEGLKGIGNKGYKISTTFINKKKNEERLKIREKEREYDNNLREKENQMLFKNIENKDNYLIGTENLNTLLDKNMNELLAIGTEEKKPVTTFEIEDYNSNPITNNSNSNNNKIETKNDNDLNKNNKLTEKEKEKEKELNIKKSENNENEVNEKEKEEDKNEINIENMNLEQLLLGIPDLVLKEIEKDIKTNIPKETEELFKYKIDWDLISKYELKRKRIKKFVEKKLLDYFDEVDSFTKFILEKLGILSPDELKEKLKYVLEESTEVSISIFNNYLLYRNL